MNEGLRKYLERTKEERIKRLSSPEVKAKIKRVKGEKLTLRQKNFIRYLFEEGMNKAEAYELAFNGNYGNKRALATAASNLLRKDKVKKYIRDNFFNEEKVKEECLKLLTGKDKNIRFKVINLMAEILGMKKIEDTGNKVVFMNNVPRPDAEGVKIDNTVIQADKETEVSP